MLVYSLQFDLSIEQDWANIFVLSAVNDFMITQPITLTLLALLSLYMWHKITPKCIINDPKMKHRWLLVKDCLDLEIDCRQVEQQKSTIEMIDIGLTDQKQLENKSDFPGAAIKLKNEQSVASDVDVVIVSTEVKSVEQTKDEQSVASDMDVVMVSTEVKSVEQTKDEQPSSNEGKADAVSTPSLSGEVESTDHERAKAEHCVSKRLSRTSSRLKDSKSPRGSINITQALKQEEIFLNNKYTYVMAKGNRISDNPAKYMSFNRGDIIKFVKSYGEWDAGVLISSTQYPIGNKIRYYPSKFTHKITYAEASALVGVNQKVLASRRKGRATSVIESSAQIPITQKVKTKRSNSVAPKAINKSS